MNILKKLFLFLLQKMAGLYEKAGVWIIPDHFYTSIPELGRIKENNAWDTEPNDLAGIDLNMDLQKDLLEAEFVKYVNEYNYPLNKFEVSDPGSFYFNNGMFANTDAEVYYCMVRHFRPQRIIEVGAGRSTQICCAAVRKNSEKFNIKAKVDIIEPYPNSKIIDPLQEKLDRIIKTKVQDVNIGIFKQLNKNDILFIDSSHVIKSAGDVNYLFLDVIPRLNPGVIVHIHDIRIPYEVPKLFIVKQSRFFTEQYLLQAFLINNKDFEILWGTYVMTKMFPKKIAAVFRSSNKGRYAGGSFWIRRKEN